MDENIKLSLALEKGLKDIEKDKIGLLKEHTLHRVLKFYLSLDYANHEIKIGRMYADVVLDNHIYEIQTKSFNLMRKKLEFFLKEHEVTIVYPMALNKVIYLTNDYGELVSVKKSPKHANPLEIFWELYKIKNFLLDENLHFKILMLDIDEYRIEKEITWKRRKGFERDNQVPKKINHIYDINTPSDFKDLVLKYNLKEVFTSKDFSKSTKLNIKKSTTALNVLTHLNVVERIGKEKNSYLYRVV
ncbi:MAG: hypothetical protein E7183_01010 [Erysipelotrichaceae bacterium]|nr:hypothetical protein [Erysipelotrichaceae bacterium]